MNDSEIIKALECCEITYDCTNCPANRDDNKYTYMGSYICKGIQKRDILDLINRQQAEIDRLNIDLMAMRGAANSYKAHYEDLKSENLVLSQKRIAMFERIEIIDNARIKAIREFAEKLKNKCRDSVELDDYRVTVVTKSDIDDLVEEMGCNDGK